MKLQEERHELFNAVVQVESGGNCDAVGGFGEIGPAQIRQCVLDDLRTFCDIDLEIEDVTSLEVSRTVFHAYTSLWVDRIKYIDSPEIRARIWNGGPYGPRKSATEKYWIKVLKEMS